MLPGLLLLPLLASFAFRWADPAMAADWRTARQDSSRQAPDPAATREAVLQVYSARAYGWRGALGVHTWVAVKPRGAPYYLRLEVIGWGVNYGASAVRIGVVAWRDVRPSSPPPLHIPLTEPRDVAGPVNPGSCWIAQVHRVSRASPAQVLKSE